VAHTKSQGAANRTVNVAGKRLGVKVFAGEEVRAGAIILRQRGTQFYPGKNAELGKDYTIFSKIDGVVSFRTMAGKKRGKKAVDILPAEAKKKVAAK
jgi:large subunit ribosomal protein L27